MLSLLDPPLKCNPSLGELYENASVEEKKIILSSPLFKKKITFQDEKVRTPQVNKFVKLISLINSELYSKNKGTNPKNLDLCRQVEPRGFEPMTSALSKQRSKPTELRFLLESMNIFKC